MFRNVEKEASLQALTDAKIFSNNHAQFISKNPPCISLANDGELNFYWKKNSLIADLGFYGDGEYSYYVRIYDDGVVAHKVSIPKDEVLKISLMKNESKVLVPEDWNFYSVLSKKLHWNNGQDV